MPEPVCNSVRTRVRFGDVVRLSRERSSEPERDGFERYVGLDHLDSGDLKIRRWGDITEGTTFTNVFRSGHVLFGKRRAYQRKVALADFDGVCSGDIYVLESKDERLLPELLPVICQTEGFFEHAVGTSAGSLSPRTNWDSISGYEFDLPPIDEQRRIASALEAIRSTQDLYTRMSWLLAIAMQALMANVLDVLKHTVTSSSLHEHAEIQYGLTVNPNRRTIKEQIRYLRVANVLRGAFDLTEIKTVGKSPTDEAYRLISGDILIVEGHADVAQIGRAALWRNDIPDMFHQNHLIRVRPNASLDPEYLCLLLNSTHGQSYFRSHAKSSSGLNTINSTVVKNYTIPVPSRETQGEIVKKAGLSARMLAEISKRQADLTRLSRIILDRLEVYS
jgi:restriction endonuclease S subunit